MSFELRLPNIGEGVTEADIAEILVSVGDEVAVNQTVMELETEKAVVELPCPQAGRVEKIVVSPGDTVSVDALLMLIATGEGGAKSESKPESKDEAPEKKPAPQPETKAAPAQKEEKPAPQTEIVEGTIEFAVPPLGEGVSSADIAEILVREGDVITAEQAVMELETEKAVVELPCPHPGKIKKIHVSPGDTVNVGAVVLTIETTSKVGSSDKKKENPKPAAPAPKPAEAKVEKAPAPQVPAKSSPAPLAQEKPTAESGSPVPAAPSTRRLARQLGVDLQQVRGSGRGGRIVQEDVQNYVKEKLQKSNLPAKAETTGGLMAGSLAPPPLPDFSRYGVIEREKMSKIARTAAENLTVSWNVIPHVTQHDRVDITDLEEARKRFVSGVGKNGPKITMTAIVIKALAKCLQAYPKFNSSLDPETNEIVYKKFYNIGCAVDTPHGLLVPVVKDCDKKSILEIAMSISELAEKARDRKLPVADMQGATCTVTNLGGIGGIAFTPIVNYPEVCILGMCRGQQELKLVEGKVVERLMLPLSLSYDHRVINGADAARFMVALTNLLGDPFQLMAMV
ncbi:2-oxo acid dehydrogenase subunit E2 [Planctomicrobium sp. SH661]|uniref:2-oxo acid dehydrogenase subunit E2 n=1 Tax=Planctomicrobium sp. SH661 TaxID=3448124 RepID=UPI003F5CB64E